MTLHRLPILFVLVILIHGCSGSAGPPTGPETLVPRPDMKTGEAVTEEKAIGKPVAPD